MPNAPRCRWAVVDTQRQTACGRVHQVLIDCLVLPIFFCAQESIAQQRAQDQSFGTTCTVDSA